MNDRSLQHQYENAVRESGLDKFYKAKQAREAQVSRESRNRTLLTCGAFLAAVMAVVAAGKGCVSMTYGKNMREEKQIFHHHNTKEPSNLIDMHY